MAFIFGKRSKKRVTDATITQTLMVSLKKNRIIEAPHKKKTTFLELLFDLAVVFVFATLSSKFAEYIGISPVGFIGGNEMLEVSHSEVGIFYWIINFIALWQVWYRYGVLFRNYGNEGVTSHLLTFSLILGVGIQAITLSVSTEFFSKYGLIISFAANKLLLYVFELIIVYNLVRVGHTERKNLRKVAYETVGMVIFTALFIMYLILERNHVVSIHYDGQKHDDWQIELFVSIIIAVSVIVDQFVSMIFRTQTLQMNEMTIYAHTKERHHLLVIIALGESVLFNVGKDVSRDGDMLQMMPDLVLNLLVVMAMWFLYKSYVYRMSYEKGSRNVTLFATSHIFIIAGMMLMFSSLEGYAEARTEYDHLIHIQTSLSAQPIFVALDDLKHSMELTFPVIYMAGLAIYILSLVFMLWTIKYGDEHYDQVVMMKRTRTTAVLITILVLVVGVWFLLIMGLHLKITYILLGILIALFIDFLLGVYWTNKFMLKVAGSEDNAIEELEQLEK